ncbi:hypothetical protein HOLleu_42658 [Holothuria leucospilota]|uniref:Uncharacterized protein n=1 Tax=Holothuria leucospilota TaxID=206669 RepID=A0A9Q0YA44_HOLLE|nr:hypothetical protein HOLleu_42658 [Holothuria leucospilota]
MYEPLQSFFLSEDKCPVVLRRMFEDLCTEQWLAFMHVNMSLFHNTIKRLEGEGRCVIETTLIIDDEKLTSRSHEIPEARFPKQDNWHNQNVENVFNTTHGLVCYIRSGKKREPNVLTQLFKLPSLDSNDNPQVIYSKVISRQGYKKLFLAFIDKAHLVMCYNKTLEIIDISSKVVLRGHQLHAAAKTMDVEEGEIFVVVGNSSAVTVFNQNLEEITKLPLTLEDWKHPADMKVTSERLFIICKVKPRDHDTPYNWPKRAMSFRRDDGEMEANYTIPIDRFTKPVSIAAHKESEFVGVLWSKTASTCMVSLHTLSGCCVFVLDVKHSHTIQILNKNTMAVINQTDGLKFYNMVSTLIFTYFTSSIIKFVTNFTCKIFTCPQLPTAGAILLSSILICWFKTHTCTHTHARITRRKDFPQHGRTHARITRRKDFTQHGRTHARITRRKDFTQHGRTHTHPRFLTGTREMSR